MSKNKPISRILLTGGSGMVGRNILDYSSSMPYYEINSPNSKELNLLNKDDVYQYINETKPDIIVHAAGKVGGIQANMADPVNFLLENLNMGQNVILAAKENNVKKFLNLSSSCVYPRNAVNPLQENLILKGELEPTNEGYALAKIFSTKLCEYISKEDSNFLYKTIIPCNLYGKYDKFSPNNSHMLPAVIRKIDTAKRKGIKKVDIWGDGNSRREFMYAEDLADFIFYALNNLESMPQNLNVGLGVDYSINEYYETVAKIIGYDGDFFHDLSKPVGMKQKVVDVKRLHGFGWKPSFSLSEGIKRTYQYFKENYND